MKIFVLGVSGMAGHTIALYFQEKGYDVIGLSTSPFKYCKNIECSVFDIDHLKKIIQREKFDAIINCIGILNKSAEDNRSEAVYLNSYLPHKLASLIRDDATRLIHMSTDCVFSGNTGPYNEESIPDGKTFYDRTKALGEVIDQKNITFRNSIIGPDMKVEGIGLFNWFMKQKNEIKGFRKAIWTGVTTLTLAKAMESALQSNLTGLYNLVNNQSISKYDLLQLFNIHFRDSSVTIIEDNDFVLDKTLLNNRNDFSFKVPSYEQMIFEMKEWIDLHAKIYSHYF